MTQTKPNDGNYVVTPPGGTASVHSDEGATWLDWPDGNVYEWNEEDSCFVRVAPEPPPEDRIYWYVSPDEYLRLESPNRGVWEHE